MTPTFGSFVPSTPVFFEEAVLTYNVGRQNYIIRRLFETHAHSLGQAEAGLLKPSPSSVVHLSGIFRDPWRGPTETRPSAVPEPG